MPPRRSRENRDGEEPWSAWWPALNAPRTTFTEYQVAMDLPFGAVVLPVRLSDTRSKAPRKLRAYCRRCLQRLAFDGSRFAECRCAARAA